MGFQPRSKRSPESPGQNLTVRVKRLPSNWVPKIVTGDPASSGTILGRVAHAKEFFLTLVILACTAFPVISGQPEIKKEIREVKGKKVRAYAAENHMEYFAEGTETYFYRNDFYPFVRAELKSHDPVIHDLLVEIWGPLG